MPLVSPPVGQLPIGLGNQMGEAWGGLGIWEVLYGGPSALVGGAGLHGSTWQMDTGLRAEDTKTASGVCCWGILAPPSHQPSGHGGQEWGICMGPRPAERHSVWNSQHESFSSTGRGMGPSCLGSGKGCRSLGGRLLLGPIQTVAMAPVQGLGPGWMLRSPEPGGWRGVVRCGRGRGWGWLAGGPSPRPHHGPAPPPGLFRVLTWQGQRCWRGGPLQRGLDPLCPPQLQACPESPLPPAPAACLPQGPAQYWAGAVG